MNNISKTCDRTVNVNEINKASVKLIGELETTGKVNDVYDDIKKTLGL